MASRGKGRKSIPPIRALATVALAGWLGACSSFQPIEPPKPVAGDFSVDGAKGALSRAQAAEEAGNWSQAAESYREAAARWPVYQEAWSGLARSAMARGDGETLALARFFEDRVVDADAMHPRQARMAFVNAQTKPPEDIPAVGEWSDRMVSFFEYKDATLRQATYDARTHRSWVERYAIYPVAVGSMIAVGVVLGNVVVNSAGDN
jgi:hypothetical protein